MYSHFNKNKLSSYTSLHHAHIYTSNTISFYDSTVIMFSISFKSLFYFYLYYCKIYNIKYCLNRKKIYKYKKIWPRKLWKKNRNIFPSTPLLVYTRWSNDNSVNTHTTATRCFASCAACYVLKIIIFSSFFSLFHIHTIIIYFALTLLKNKVGHIKSKHNTLVDCTFNFILKYE